MIKKCILKIFVRSFIKYLFIHRLRDGDAEQAESLIQIHESDKEV